MTTISIRTRMSSLRAQCCLAAQHRLHRMKSSPGIPTVKAALGVALALAAAASPQAAPSTSDGAPNAQALDLPKDQFYSTPADPPFYARVERPYVAPHDDRTAVIVFYRDPECVRPDFNLLDLVDVPAAFDCELVVRGREYRAIGSDPFAPPYLSKLRNSGRVPMWFVSTAELMAAAADDVLTIDELRALPSLVRGWAAPWSERLEPAPVRSPSVTRMHARGRLPGVGAFIFDYEEVNFAITQFDIRVSP
jgi:hypothetical protein